MFKNTIKSLGILLLSVVLLAAAGCSKDDVNPDGSDNSSWLRERGNNANTGVSGISKGPSKAPSGAWKFDTDDILKSTPVVFDGKVFIGGYNEFYALNLKTGNVEWTAPYNGFSATYDEGVVFFGNDDDEFVSLDAKTGAFKWGVQTNDRVRTNPLIANGAVFFGDDDYFYSLNKTTGELIWVKDIKGTESSPAFHNGRVLFGNFNGRLYCLDAATGAEVWTFDTGNDLLGSNPEIRSAPAILKDAIYFGDVNGKIYKLNANTGALIWKYETDHRLSFGSGAVAEDKVYFTSASTAPSAVPPRIVCLNAENGAEIWAKTYKGPVYSSPVIVGDQVWFGTSDGLFATDRHTGADAWSTAQSSGGKAIWSTPVVLKGKALIGFSDGNLNLFEF